MRCFEVLVPNDAIVRAFSPEAVLDSAKRKLAEMVGREVQLALTLGWSKEQIILGEVFVVETERDWSLKLIQHVELKGDPEGDGVQAGRA